jgi:Flp pilus assembly protein TadB
VYDVRRGKPASPEELAAADKDRRRESLLPVFTVVGAGMAVVLVVVSCAGLPGILVLLALAAVVGFIALQYLVWGWWLGKRIREEEAARGTSEPPE